MNDLLKKELVTILQIPMERVEEFLDICFLVDYGKHEVIKPRNGVFDRLGYIISGAARIFFVKDNGEEISYLLQVNGDVIGDYESYLTGSETKIQVESLIETKVLCYEKKSIEALIEKDFFWMGFAKRISDLAFLSAKKRLDELFLYSPEQRYLNLLHKSPEMLSKIPQKYISTYLGITPQSLSRIRKRITSQ